MKKKIIFILPLLFLTTNVYCQKINFKNDSENSNVFTTGLGGHYTAFLRNGRYLIPSAEREINMGASLIGYKQMDSYSYDLSFSYQKVYKSLIFETGLYFSNLTHIYQSDSNSIKNNPVYFSDFFKYMDIIKFHIAYKNIEFPLGFGYKYKRNQLVGFIVLSLNLNYRFVLTDKYNDIRIETTHLFDRPQLTYYIPSNRIYYMPEIAYLRDIGKHLRLYLGANYWGYNFCNIKTGIRYKF